MYIFELIYRLIQNKKNKPEEKDPKDEFEKCEHVFLPVDSTKHVLACSKCGIIKRI